VSPNKGRSKNRLVWTSACVALSVLLRLTGDCVAGPATTPSLTRPGFVGGPYCGVYAVYAGLKLQGLNVAIEDLLKERYIGSPGGSSLTELQLALLDHGAASLAVNDLSATALDSLRCGVLLHTRTNDFSSDYDHWVLQCVSAGGGVHVLDANSPRSEPARMDVEGRWDHIAVLINPSEKDVALVRRTARREVFVCCGLGVLTVLLMRLFLSTSVGNSGSRNRWAHARRATLGVIVLTAIATLDSFAEAELSNGALFAQMAAVRVMQEAHLGDFLPVVSAETVASAGRNDLIIDARQTPDYAAGHIPDAINIPATLPIDQVISALAGVSKNKTLIVYCLGAKCTFSKQLAAKLWQAGYRNLQIFAGGWSEWKIFERGRQ
jgi:rhodanese-related sulfurtransferase